MASIGVVLQANPNKRLSCRPARPFPGQGTEQSQAPLLTSSARRAPPSIESITFPPPIPGYSPLPPAGPAHQPHSAHTPWRAGAAAATSPCRPVSLFALSPFLATQFFPSFIDRLARLPLPCIAFPECGAVEVDIPSCGFRGAFFLCVSLRGNDLVWRENLG